MADSEPTKEEPTESPYVPPVIFDYDQYQDDTTIKACVEILQCLGRNAENLIFKHDTTSEVIVEGMSKAGQEIMNIIIECKVPDVDMQKLSDRLTQIPFQVFKIVERQNREFEKELLARYIGVRDPGTKKYSREFASMGDMFEALYRLRAEQGNNVEDYYTLEKKKSE